MTCIWYSQHAKLVTNEKLKETLQPCLNIPTYNIDMEMNAVIVPLSGMTCHFALWMRSWGTILVSIVILIGKDCLFLPSSCFSGGNWRTMGPQGGSGMSAALAGTQILSLFWKPMKLHYQHPLHTALPLDLLAFLFVFFAELFFAVWKELS